jgi:hypothetical protein
MFVDLLFCWTQLTLKSLIMFTKKFVLPGYMPIEFPSDVKAIEWSEVTLGGKLGTGAYAKVYKGKYGK